MKTFIVNSSNVKSVAYDLESKVCVMTFNNGSSYSYKDIEPETICHVLFSDSVGKAFNDSIRKSYKGTKLETNKEVENER